LIVQSISQNSLRRLNNYLMLIMTIFFIELIRRLVNTYINYYDTK